jgi:NADH dehydrogenase (ubiquinone) 1 alpha subcomplex subunit 5
LTEKHQALLDKMEASDMPETAQYRIDVTKWCNYTLKAVAANPEDPEAVEDMCNMGQVEEMIEQADDEMAVLDMYLENRIWELVEQANPSVSYNPDPTVDPMGEDGDPDVAEAIREGVEGLKKEA